MLNDTICTLPKDISSVSSALIMLHGYGANGNDMNAIAPTLAKTNPSMAFYAPNAPTAMGYDAYKWFDLDDNAPADVFERLGYVERLMLRAKEQVVQVNSFIDLIMEKHHLEENKIGLLGFSQGGIVALMTGLMREKKMMGLIGCSSVPLALNKALPQSQILSTPDVLLTHGTDDDRVPLVGMELTQSTLVDINVKVTTHIVSGMGHAIDTSCIRFIADFLAEHSK